MSFALPKVIPPNIQPKIELQDLLDFDFKLIESKPIVPWIKKNKNGVIFTTQMLDVDLISEESRD